MNPFWRATLVASDVDETRAQRGDSLIRELLAIGRNRDANALRALKAQGFEAMP